jgi:hypothetical protein
MTVIPRFRDERQRKSVINLLRWLKEVNVNQIRNDPYAYSDDPNRKGLIHISGTYKKHGNSTYKLIKKETWQAASQCLMPYSQELIFTLNRAGHDLLRKDQLRFSPFESYEEKSP